MRLATLDDGSRDGRLVVVSSDLTRAVAVGDIAATLQVALDRWSEVAAALEAVAAQLAAGTVANPFEFAASRALAPLPRAWQWLDASAYQSHGALMQKLLGLDENPTGRPLMYQGLSDTFYSGGADVPMQREEDGIDFEGEFGVVVDAVPCGITAEAAAQHICLIVQINDWSLRGFARIEMSSGFGFLQAKPPCSMAPVAVTPAELGDAWRDGRVDLPLLVDWNGRRFGAAEGYPMEYSFPELIAHAAKTRRLCAGTIIGSGTVSNSNFREIGSSCIAERRGIEIVDEGAARTNFMRFGDRVRMEVLDRAGRSVFGAIDQRVVPG